MAMKGKVMQSSQEKFIVEKSPWATCRMQLPVPHHLPLRVSVWVQSILVRGYQTLRRCSCPGWARAQSRSASQQLSELFVSSPSKGE